jgi:hypothetical protein
VGYRGAVPKPDLGIGRLLWVREPEGFAVLLKQTSFVLAPILDRQRVRLNGKWHSGTAYLMPDDDPRARLGTLSAINSFGVRAFGTNLLTVRVDLDG